jgi:hypothetical protein
LTIQIFLLNLDEFLIGHVNHKGQKSFYLEKHSFRFKGIVYKDWQELDPDIALVSNGAEVIVIAAPFYRKHLNEQCRAVLTLNLEQKVTCSTFFYSYFSASKQSRVSAEQARLLGKLQIERHA